jgi:Tfp pilus assembly pilus retraction ATPase PilT
VRALGDRGKRVVSIENPIEMHHTAPSIVQRAVGEHVPTARVGVAAALSEGSDAIAIGFVGSAESAEAVVEAVAGGVLVLATVNAPTAGTGLERILGFLDTNQRDHGRSVLAEAFLGAVRVSVGRGGARSYETQAKSG